MRTSLKYCLRLKLRQRELKKELSKLDSENTDALALLQSLASAKDLKQELQLVNALCEQAKKFGFIWW